MQRLRLGGVGLLPQDCHEAATPSMRHDAVQVRCHCRNKSDRVLAAPGPEAVRGDDACRVPEPYHQARHDLPRRQALELREAPAENRGRVHALAEQGASCSSASNSRTTRWRACWCRNFVISEGTVNCWWYNPEVHQSRLTGELATRGGPGRIRHGVQPRHAAIRGGAQPPARREAFAPGRASDQRQQHRRPGRGVDTLKHLLGLSPDLAATIKCPAETFTVQDLAKLHFPLDDMAKVQPPDLMLNGGMTWSPRARC